MLAMFTTLGVARWKSSTVSLSSPDSSGNLSSGICTTILGVMLCQPVSSDASSQRSLLHQCNMLDHCSCPRCCLCDLPMMGRCMRVLPCDLYLHGLSGRGARPEWEALGLSFMRLAPQQPKGQHSGPHKAQQPVPPLLLHIAQGLLGLNRSGSKVKAEGRWSALRGQVGVERVRVAEASLKTVEDPARLAP